MDLTTLAVRRPVEEILAGRIRLRIGDQYYTLPTLSLRKNREWKENLDAQLTDLLSGLQHAENNIPLVLDLLTAAPDKLLDLLIAYDSTNVLPTRDELEDLLNEADLIRLVMEVWAAANPLVAIGLGSAGEPSLTPVSGSPKRTSTPRPRGAGRPRTSKAN